MENKKRLAIVDAERCKPSKCNQECKKKCPVVQMGTECVQVNKTSTQAVILDTCNGCGVCTRVCPFQAIKIVNLPHQLSNVEVIHRYGLNSFQLFRLPLPRKGQVLGIVGINSGGKTTALKVLGRKLMPNFGLFDGGNKDQKQIETHFRGTSLQNYFKAILKDKVWIKVQHVDQIPKILGSHVQVSTFLHSEDEELVTKLSLHHLKDRELGQLSGGELQRLAILLCCTRNSTVFIFDEPSCFLDIKQRMIVSDVIRSMARENTYVIVVEHDLSILDYMSDFICILYGEPNAYGVVSSPYSVGDGINHFLDGYIPCDNMKFRDHKLTFKFPEIENEDEKKVSKKSIYQHDSFETKVGSFHLRVDMCEFYNSEILVMMGENACGKSLYAKILAGFPEYKVKLKSSLSISYKPQMIYAKFSKTVLEFFQKKARHALVDPFRENVLKPLGILGFLEQSVLNLSGGQLQRLGIAYALAKPADLYIIDEPSAYLDCEQRIAVARVLKKFIYDTQKCALVIEHDFLMCNYLADRMMLLSGDPGISGHIHSPTAPQKVINEFLKSVNVTFRHDKETHRPRVNKKESAKDQEQKKNQVYFGGSAQ
jgi:ATP-binding cassette subfamily E protein 1